MTCTRTQLWIQTAQLTRITESRGLLKLVVISCLRDLFESFAWRLGTAAETSLSFSFSEVSSNTELWCPALQGKEKNGDIGEYIYGKDCGFKIYQADASMRISMGLCLSPLLWSNRYRGNLLHLRSCLMNRSEILEILLIMRDACRKVKVASHQFGIYDSREIRFKMITEILSVTSRPTVEYQRFFIMSLPTTSNRFCCLRVLKKTANADLFSLTFPLLSWSTTICAQCTRDWELNFEATIDILVGRRSVIRAVCK